jgi:hypothetical protein
MGKQCLGANFKRNHCKCFRRAGFDYHEEESEECEEDTGLNGAIRCLSLDVQKDLVYVDEKESGDADIL